MGGLIDMEQKGMESMICDHDHDKGVTGVTSNIGMPSTYLDIIISRYGKLV